MHPSLGTPSYEYTTINEQGTGRSSFPPHIVARWDTAHHGTAQHNTTQHNKTRHNTTQHNTTHRSTSPHSTTRHGTARHSVAQHNTARGQRPDRRSGAARQCCGRPKSGESARALPPQEHPARQGGHGAVRQDGRPPLGDEHQARPPNHKQGAETRRHPKSPLIGNGAGEGCTELQRARGSGAAVATSRSSTVAAELLQVAAPPEHLDWYGGGGGCSEQQRGLQRGRTSSTGRSSAAAAELLKGTAPP